jgi:hypothetical protein
MANWVTQGNNINANNDWLGTTNNQPLVIRTNNTERMRVTPNGDITWGNNSHLLRDQGGSIELGGDNNTPGIGTPYIDFHIQGLTQDFNTRIINDGFGRLTISADTLRALGDITWGNNSHLLRDQGGSIELGGDSETFGAGTPYIDFHFASGTSEDFNTRIINDGNGQLTISAGTLRALGNIDVRGDIRLSNADCAEDFDISAEESAENIEPGTVMVIDEGGALKRSQQPYDKRVAGVISGAGDYKSGIILDRQAARMDRTAVALMGKVYCKADARYAPIEVGDLLTTSPTPGHAMKVCDPVRASGATIGKTLQGLTGGEGLLPILVALQ